MEDSDIMYHLDNLRQCDVEYVVDVLGITTDKLINTFLGEAIDFIKKDMG